MPSHVHPLPLTVHNIEGAVTEFSPDLGVTYYTIPGAESYEETGGEAAVRSGVTAGAAWARVGIPALPLLQLEAQYAPQHPTWERIRTAFEEGSFVYLRETLAGEDVFQAEGATNTVAIDTSGAVTFGGTQRPNFNSNLFAEGQTIVVGTTSYVIISLTRVGSLVTVMVEAIALAQAAAQDYKLSLPSLRREAVGKFANAGRGRIPGEGNLMTTLAMQAYAEPTDWEII